jgi:hypothetical protein
MAEYREALDRIHVVRMLLQERTVERLRLGHASGAVMLGCR